MILSSENFKVCINYASDIVIKGTELSTLSTAGTHMNLRVIEFVLSFYFKYVVIDFRERGWERER